LRVPADTTCHDARTWLSAFRDGEALPEQAPREHIDGCAACGAWESTLDQIARRYAVRSVSTPDVTAPALAAWRTSASRSSHAGQQRVARGMLALSGLGGLVLAAVTFTGLLGPGSSHFLRDLVAFECAIAVGFLLAAWRPDRYLRGLLPVAGVAALLIMTGSTGTIAGTRADLLVELSHLPVLLGVFGLFVLVDARPTTGPRRRRIA
jgi:predicted anti-sigma-YlaC factor YlaD